MLLRKLQLSQLRGVLHLAPQKVLDFQILLKLLHFALGGFFDVLLGVTQDYVAPKHIVALLQRQRSQVCKGSLDRSLLYPRLYLLLATLTEAGQLDHQWSCFESWATWFRDGPYCQSKRSASGSEFCPFRGTLTKRGRPCSETMTLLPFQALSGQLTTLPALQGPASASRRALFASMH